LIPPARRGGGKRRVDMRAVMNGVMYILSTGCQWRYIPKDFPPRSTLHDYFTWWLCGAARKQSGRPAPPLASSLVLLMACAQEDVMVRLIRVGHA
jgi:transposase